MRFIKHFFLMMMASAFLVACGGGGGDPISGGGGSAGVNLNAVYDQLTRGMSYDQVKGLVGYAHNGGESNYGSGETNYKWNSGEGSASFCTLQVSIDAVGAKSAIYVGGCDGCIKSRTKIL